MANSMESDLGKIVEHGVSARIEAEVLAALSGSDLMARFVTAALNEKVEGRNYGDKETLLNKLLRKSIQEQTKEVVSEEIARLEPVIREHVREALAKSIDVITDSLVSGFVASANGRYPSIEVNFRARD